MIALVSVLVWGCSGSEPQPDAQPLPLRALWTDVFGCGAFMMLDTQQRLALSGLNGGFYVGNLSGQRFTLDFSTYAEAEDWLIGLFIKVNGLDATLADVPLTGSGQRDCLAWNTQLVTS